MHVDFDTRDSTWLSWKNWQLARSIRDLRIHLLLHYCFPSNHLDSILRIEIADNSGRRESRTIFFMFSTQKILVQKIPRSTIDHEA